MVDLVWADAEGDNKCVELAAEHGGYIIGRDSDFAVMNKEGYRGYIPIDEMIWSAREEDEGWQGMEDSIASLSVSGISGGQASIFGEDIEEEGWTSTRSRSKKRSKVPTLPPGTPGGILAIANAKGLIPAPLAAWTQCLTLNVYHPSKLAAHLKIPIRFLPLLGSLVGNDFTPESFAPKFFDKRLTSSQRIDRVAEVLQELSEPPSSRIKTGNNKKRSIVEKARENVGGNGVASIISGAIQLLLRFEIASGELESMIETIIESLLQYGSESDPAGPIGARCQLLSSSHSTTDGIIVYAPHPFFHSSRAQHLPDVSRLYTHAYRAGKFAPRVLDLVTSGTYWSTVFLEDPDIESCGRTIGEELSAWVAAILADGIPIGAIDGAQLAESPAQTKAEGQDDDDDELIDVMEDESDREDIDERGRARGRYPTIFPEDEDDDEEEEDPDVHFALDANGYPTALLTKALQRLRREQKVSAQQRGSPTIDSPLSPGTMSPSPLGLSAVVSHPLGTGNTKYLTDVSLDPTFVTTYFRRGSQYTPSSLCVPKLSSLLDPPLSEAPSRPPTWLKPDIRKPFPKNWQGPIQLQSQDIRFSIFCYALVSNTPNVRGLPNDWISICVAVRWVVLKMGEKSLGGMARWKKSDAKAFLISCIQEKQNSGDDYFVTSASASIISSSYLSLRSAPSVMANSQQLPPQSPSVTGQPHPDEPPLDASPRAVQLTAQILVAIEMIQNLSSVLLLADRVHPLQAGRLFSGKRFHGLLARIHNEGPPDDEKAFLQTHLQSEESQEIFEMMWSAVEDGLKAEWWGEEWVSSAAAKKERKKAKKVAIGTTQRNTPVIRGKPLRSGLGGGMFSALATANE